MPFSVLAKPVGALCNLDCHYCFYLEKERLYPGRTTRADWTMDERVLEAYIRGYIESQPASVVHFAWQGGEPTLAGVEFFERVIELQQRHAAGKRVENSLQTNGVLLDERWCAFLAEHRFLVGLSIDGPRAVHDKHRVDHGGAPTFDKVVAAMQLLKRHGVEFNTLTTVQRGNVRRALEVYRFLREVGSGHMQFIPVVERVARRADANGLVLLTPQPDVDATLAPWAVDAVDYGRFLCTIFDEWVRHDVGRVFVQTFEVALGTWAGLPPSLCVFAENCGDALVVEHNGDVYSCDHYVYPQNRLGNVADTPIAELAARSKQRAFGQAKSATLPPDCLECRYLFACGGDCPKHRFARTTNGTFTLSYLCRAYKRFFSHVDPYMRYMAGELDAQRSPASVMEWARTRNGRDKA